MIWTTKNAKHGIDIDEIERAVKKNVLVPVGMNLKLASEYNMLPDQEIGEYIEKLNGVISNEGRTLTKKQAQQIMLIILAGCLYGMHQYCKNKKNIELRKYLAFDDQSMYLKLGPMLECLDKPYEPYAQNLWRFLYELQLYGCSYEHVCIDSRHFRYIFYNNISGYSSYEKSRLSYKDSETLSNFYTKSDGDENPLLFVDFGKMVCRHTHPQYDSRNSIWDGKYAGRRVLQMCDLVGAVKNMGDEYIVAPAFNLYANAVLRNISDYRQQFLSK